MTQIAVPPGYLASVVTHLEMRQKPELAAQHESIFAIKRWKTPDLAPYRALFAQVGLPWLWMSRLVMDDADVRAIIGHNDVHIFRVLDTGGTAVGLIELDYRIAHECEIAFLALMSEHAGQGHGRSLMQWILRQAWGHDGVARLWLHSCSFDHPGALRFYRRSGFVAFAREVEILPDPRLSGHLPRDAAPHVPLIEHSVMR